MNLIQLKSFVTVAHAGNFTRAAHRLNLSQPAISGHIRGLEEDLGVKLFRRGHRCVELSEQGRALLGHAERVLIETEHLVSAAKEIARKPMRSMRLGFVVGTEVVRMSPLLALLARTMPHVRIDVAQGLSGWVAAGVDAGRFDGGFYLGPTPPKGLYATELEQLTYLLCTPAEWGCDARQSRPEKLAQLPWVWAPEGASYPVIVKEMFSRYGITPRQAIEADREATIADLVTSGIGVAILREPLARRNAEAGRVAILEEYRAHVPMYFLSPLNPDPDVQHLRNCVLEVFGIGRDQAPIASSRIQATS